MPESARKQLLVLAALLVTAIILTLPAALGPVRLNDSFWIDWVWLDQFARELASGTFYPRWLPQSHGGLGSPVFYYYPPLAFYAGSAFVLARLSTFAAVIATFFAAYLLSGAGMYWWLKGQSRAPLIGALVYMIAPYHTFNFYIRGAIAEFLATAILPFVMLGVRRLSRNQAGGFAIVAISYAALIGSHLPLALLASIFLIGPYALIQSYRAPRVLITICAALAMGLLLAGIYLVPAFLLEPYRDTAKLWENALLQPRNWTFWNPEFRTSRNYIAVLVIGAALAIPLVGLIVRNRSRWAAWGLVCTLLAVGVVPVLWSLPVLRSVQFPFRLLPVAEFALATATSLVTWRRFAFLVPCAPLLAISASIAVAAPAKEVVSMADARTLHPDVPENLPPGKRPYSWPSRWALNVGGAHRHAQLNDGATVEPVFYFPSWQVHCDGRRARAFPDPRTQLLSYRGRNCARSLGWTDPEKAGAALSLLALLVLMVVGAAGPIRLRGGSIAQKTEPKEVRS